MIIVRPPHSFLKGAFLLFAIICFVQDAGAQNIPLKRERFIYFPHPLVRKWVTSIGINATTMPYEVTEELHYQIPALDVHSLIKLGKHINLDARAQIQVIQNLVSLGPRWTRELTDRTCLSIGDDFGFWFGHVTVEGFKTRGYGFQNYPNASLGYRFNKRILFTFKAEALMTLDINTHAGDIPVTSKFTTFSGSAYTVAIEQPFYGKKSLTLGFRAIYTNFFWQTWSAFTSFDRNFFYPQLIVGVIL